MIMKNAITDQFQKEAKVIFLAEDLLLAKLRANPDEVELEEIIHELRIHIRKLISLLFFYKPLLRRKKRKALISSLKILLRNFGSLRTRHMYLKSAEDFSRHLSSEEKKLFTEMNERELDKSRFLKEKNEKLDPIEFRVLYEDMLKKLLGYGKRIFKASACELTLENETFVVDRYQELMELYFEMERNLDFDSVKEVHDLRVLAKNMIYTLKRKTDILGELAVKRVEHLKKIQDVAGKIHDADVHRKILSSFETSEEEEKLRTRFQYFIMKEREESTHKLKKVIEG
ncbi:MAG: CHAD domain-containing protein [Clostridia bacterium]|nr:CHAD domain-containing protein [Clostridia bacterium]